MVPQIRRLKELSDVILLEYFLLLLGMSLRDVELTSRHLALVIFITKLDDSHDHTTQVLQGLVREFLIPPSGFVYDSLPVSERHFTYLLLSAARENVETDVALVLNIGCAVLTTARLDVCEVFFGNPADRLFSGDFTVVPLIVLLLTLFTAFCTGNR